MSRCTLITLLASLLTLTTTSAKEDAVPCGLYLAVSSTSTAELTTWGLYAGETIPEGASIGYPDMAVSILHLKANAHFSTPDSEKETFLQELVDFVESLVWVAGPAGSKFELEEGRSVAAIPGAGALAAFNNKLTNSAWSNAATYQRVLEGEESGVTHPSRGAITPFYNATVVSTMEIKQGSEIFMDYGENWAKEESAEDVLQEDFVKLDETVDKLLTFFAKHEGSLDEASKMEIYNFVVKDVMQAAVGQGKAKKIAAILPPSPDVLHKVKEMGGTLPYSQPEFHRSQEWLQEHGLCMDHIRPGPSTIPDAGRGAFATRKLKKGTSISPIPLVHIPDKAILDMHSMQETNGNFVRSSDEVVDQQLLVNYCFGHPSSSMVFMPTGAISSYINHADKPNAKLVWSSHPSHNKVWYEMDPKELLEEDNMYIGLLLEVVALRDIKEGEEIFLDYGKEWKAAWKKHTQDWKARIKSGELPKTWPLKAIDMNTKYQDKPYPTVDEENDFPETVELMAFLLILDNGAEGTLEEPATWGAEEGVAMYRHDHIRSCDILSATKDEASGSYTYTVRWTGGDDIETIVADVPHQAFVFVDEAGTSDQFVTGAFRHYIGIPDDVFPKGAWRNVA